VSHFYLPYLKAFAVGGALTAALVAAVHMPAARASDHNDGPRVVDPANHAGDITDVYSIRESDQSGNPADSTRVLLVMTLDGLVAPGQTHQFDPAISYNLHVGLGAGATADSSLLDFRFSPPAADGSQQIYMQGNNVGTTSVGVQGQEVVNTWQSANGPVKVFAGPRDDPFFLDLQVIRCGLGCAGGAPNAQDSFGKSNVSAIVASLPMAYLQKGSSQQVFTVWGETRK